MSCMAPSLASHFIKPETACILHCFLASLSHDILQRCEVSVDVVASSRCNGASVGKSQSKD